MIYDDRSRQILLSVDVNGNFLKEQNSLIIEEKKYYLNHLSKDGRPSKGGNSSVYVLIDEQGVEPEKIIKISNYWKSKTSVEWIKRRYGRFINEIDALNKVKDHNTNPNVVSIEADGFETISGRSFPYYVMEKADSDLKEFLLYNGDKVDFIERVKLCRDIFWGIKSLHDLGFYHRDIKPDNILLFYSGVEIDEGSEDSYKFTWKVGDLGLIKHRDMDYDDIGEKIGPIGWLSPEAMNKYLTEEALKGLDCVIDNSSDIFQMGKLFWFIFHYNVPIGQLNFEDFTFEMPQSKFVYDMILGMLQYPKTRRKTSQQLEEEIQMLSLEFGI